MYILGEPPETQNEAYDALENVFGSSEFSAQEAIEVISNVLETELMQAQTKFTTLLRAGHVEEV